MDVFKFEYTCTQKNKSVDMVMYILMCVYVWICINIGCRVLWFKIWARFDSCLCHLWLVFLASYLTSLMWLYHLLACTLRIIVSLYRFIAGVK